MRTISIVLIVCFFSIGIARAQQFEGGLLAGMTFCQVDGDTYSGYNKLGVMAGGYVKLPINDKWAFRIEMEYISKGSVHNYNPNVYNDVDYLNKTTYIEMPLLFDYNLEVALANVNMPEYLKKVRVYGGLGGAVLLTGKEEINDVSSEGINPGFSTMNLTGIFGIQYVISPHWNADFRWDNSISSIRTGEAPGYSQRFWVKYGQYNNLLAVSLFYKI